MTNQGMTRATFSLTSIGLFLALVLATASLGLHARSLTLAKAPIDGLAIKGHIDGLAIKGHIDGLAIKGHIDGLTKQHV